MSGTSVRGILFTDVVGSTEMRAQLGEDRADELRRAHDELLGRCVDRHEGRVLRWTGDGIKADFATASAAVSAAIDMQRAVARYGRTATAVAPFEIRIGLGIGEVTDEDGDIHGVAVIEAARLEALADPGGILATDLVHRLGQRRVDAGFEELGPHLLKGLADPVEVVRIVDAATPTTRPMARAVLLDRRFPLVGRTADVAAATACWDLAVDGRPTLALVTGQAGMGKSRLISHVADVAHAQGAMVLAGACDSDLDVPYQPFATALDEIRAVDTELATAVADGSGPLGPLFPNRRRRTADHAASARFDLFESVVDLLHRLTEDQPVVVVLEDLHWATPPTVQLLRHVLRHAGESRVLLIASYRAEEIGPGHPLNDLLAEVRPGAAVTKIDLQPLDEGHVAELVSTRVTAATPEQVDVFARRVRDESAGSPFFVCELLHHLATAGELETLVGRGAAEHFPIPDSVRDVVGQRLGRLSPRTGDVLQVAAIIGHSFDVDVLAAVTGDPVEEVVELLEDTERVALVREASAGRFTFAHAIVRTTLLGAASATRRRLAHRRIAEAIESLRPSDHDVLAHHWFEAGVDDKANERLELAAQRDLEALAYESAAERYLSLIEYHRTSPSGDDTGLARGWLGLGLARRAMGLPVYREAIDEAGRRARRLRDPDLMADAAIASIWPGTMFATAGVTDADMVALCEDALVLLPADDRRRVRILSTLASHLAFETDRAHRVGVLAEARDLARADGDPELMAGVLVSEYLSLWDASTAWRRAEIATEVARTGRAIGDPDLTFLGGLFTAIGAAESCDVRGARRLLEALGDDADRTRNFYFRFLVERFLLSLDILSGRQDVQDEIDALAKRYAETHADTDGTWSIQTGGLALQFGTLPTMVPAIRSMIDASTVSANWVAALGIALELDGDREGAMAALDSIEDPPLDYFWLVTMQAISELVVALGRVDLAPRLRDSLRPHCDQLGVVASGSFCFGLVRTTLGQLALLCGDHTEAVELLRDAVRVADAIDAPYEATKSRRVLAAALRADGSPADEVATVVADAAALAERHGFAVEAGLLAG